MAKETNGVFQNKDNSWGFRFTAVIDGKQITKRKTKDENGQKFPTKKAAAKAREAAIAKAHIEVKQKQKIYRRTMADVYKEYCESGRTGKAYQTNKNRTACGITTFPHDSGSVMLMIFPLLKLWTIFPNSILQRGILFSTPKAF